MDASVLCGSKRRLRFLTLYMENISSLPHSSPSLLSMVLGTKSISKVSCICCPRKWFRCSCSMRLLSSSSKGSQVPPINHWPLITGIWSCSVRKEQHLQSSRCKQFAVWMGIVKRNAVLCLAMQVLDIKGTGSLHFNSSSLMNPGGPSLSG